MPLRKVIDTRWLCLLVLLAYWSYYPADIFFYFLFQVAPFYNAINSVFAPTARYRSGKENGNNKQGHNGAG